jgi:Flp pilus assembly protein TadG
LSTGNRRRGQGLVEFTLVLPVMMLILLVAVDFGRVFFSYIETTNAAREGANYAAAHAADSPFNSATYASDVTAAALGETNAQGQRGAGSMTVSAPSCVIPGTTPTSVACNIAAQNAAGIGDQVSVTVTQPFTFFTPLIGGFFGGQLTLSSSATAPVLNPALSNLAIPSTGACITVPDLTGMTVSAARTAWTNTAGFTGSFSPNGLNNKIVTGQDQDAGTCKPATTTVTVTHT